MSALLRGLTFPISSRTMDIPHWFPNGKRGQFTTNRRPWQDGRRFFKIPDGGFLPAFSSSVARLFAVVLAKEVMAKEESLTVYGLVPFISSFTL